MTGPETEQMIEQLVATHGRRRRLMAPVPRALLWMGITVTLGVLLLWYVQPFRSGFMTHLLASPILMLEVVSCVVLAWVTLWQAFRLSVPGAALGAWGQRVGVLAATVLLVSLVVSMTGHGAPPTAHGGRAACWLEVMAYGSLMLLILVPILFRGYPRFTGVQALAFGCAAALPVAGLMQLACLYNPVHGLVFHYGPVLVVALVGWCLQGWMRR